MLRNPEYEGSDLLSTIKEAESNSLSQSAVRTMTAQLFQGALPVGPALTIVTQRGHSPVSIQALGNATWHVQEILDPTNQTNSLYSDQQEQGTAQQSTRSNREIEVSLPRR